MPYQAAKAIAATFCWPIRWVLTPVFGYDFPETCLGPDDPGYGKFLIAPEIVRRCTDDTNRFRQEGCEYQASDAVGAVAVQTPNLPNLNTPWEPMSHHPRKSEESGYYTGGDQIDRLTVSPQVSPRGSAWIHGWNSINGPKSTSSSPIVHSPTFDRMANELPPLHQYLRVHEVSLDQRPTSFPRGYHHETVPAKRRRSQIANDYCPAIAPRNPTSRSSTAALPQIGDPSDRNRTGKELEAAEILQRLSAADQVLPDPKRTRRGSHY